MYASLSPSVEGIKAVKKCAPIMLPAFSVENSHDTPLSPVCSNHHRDNDDHDLHNTSRKRRGKGCHLLPLVKKLLESKENWKVITDKENYQFLGTFLFPTQNMLWYVEDITKLTGNPELPTRKSIRALADRHRAVCHIYVVHRALSSDKDWSS